MTIPGPAELSILQEPSLVELCPGLWSLPPGSFYQVRFPIDFELTTEVNLINCISTTLDLSMMDEGIIYYGSSLEKMIDSAWEHRKRLHGGTTFALILDKLVEAVETRSQNIRVDGQAYAHYESSNRQSLKGCVCFDGDTYFLWISHLAILNMNIHINKIWKTRINHRKYVMSIFLLA